MNILIKLKIKFNGQHNYNLSKSSKDPSKSIKKGICGKSIKVYVGENKEYAGKDICVIRDVIRYALSTLLPISVEITSKINILRPLCLIRT